MIVSICSGLVACRVLEPSFTTVTMEMSPLQVRLAEGSRRGASTRSGIPSAACERGRRLGSGPAEADWEPVFRVDPGPLGSA